MKFTKAQQDRNDYELAHHVKQCGDCGEFVGWDLFGRDKRKRHGLHGSCKSCKAAYNKIYRQENKVEIAANQKIYNQKNKVERAAKNKIRANKKSTALKKLFNIVDPSRFTQRCHVCHAVKGLKLFSYDKIELLDE